MKIQNTKTQKRKNTKIQKRKNTKIQKYKNQYYYQNFTINFYFV